MAGLVGTKPSGLRERLGSICQRLQSVEEMIDTAHGALSPQDLVQVQAIQSVPPHGLQSAESVIAEIERQIDRLVKASQALVDRL